MLRLDAVIGDGGAGPDAGGTRDIRPEWSGDGGHRCVGDGDGISVVDPPVPSWSAASWVAAAAVPVVPGLRYFCGNRYCEAVNGCYNYNNNYYSLPKTVLGSDSVAVFKSRLKTFLFPRLSLLSLLTNTLPCSSASEVTTLWRYTNLLIIIIIINNNKLLLLLLLLQWRAPMARGLRYFCGSRYCEAVSGLL